MSTLRCVTRQCCQISKSGVRTFAQAQKKDTFGFIGLGQMGSRMANNLLAKSDQKIVVFDTYTPACEEIALKGARIANSARDVAEQSSVVITMLRSDAQVNSVYTDSNDGLLAGIQKDSLLIDSSTVNYATSKAIAEMYAAEQPSVELIDAPVSGGIGAAEAGSLTFMCGGSASAFERGKSVLQHMGGRIFHCGAPPGSGQIAKICNNLVLAISMCAVSEGMNLGTKLGMDPTKLAEILNVSSGRCWSSDTYNPSPGVMPAVPASNQYNGGFVIDLMRKDLKLAAGAAESCGAQLPLGSNIEQLYDMLATRGYGDKDFSFIYQFIKGAETDDSYKQ